MEAVSERYQVQSRVPFMGSQGQERLLNAHVSVVGAGGLGSVILPLLVGAGVGKLTIYDPDRVELSNLHRQTLYTTYDIGKPKIHIARERLLSLNPEIRIDAHQMSVSPDTVESVASISDIIVDAADRFSLTYPLNDACMALKRPFISGSVQGMQGYAGAFAGSAPSYRAVFPYLPGDLANCSTSGVLGPVVSMVGSVMAQMIVSLIIENCDGNTLGSLVRCDAQQIRCESFRFDAAAEPAIVASSPRFVSYMQLRSSDLVIDLRAQDELPALGGTVASIIHLPLADLCGSLHRLPNDKRIVLCCQTGVRAAQAARILAESGFQNLALMAMK